MTESGQKDDVKKEKVVRLVDRNRYKAILRKCYNEHMSVYQLIASTIRIYEDKQNIIKTKQVIHWALNVFRFSWSCNRFAGSDGIKDAFRENFRAAT